MKTRIVVLAIGLMGLAIGCAEEGEEGSAAIDCGDHGTEHEGHCHCDAGYLFDGETCVDPSAVTVVCGTAEAEEQPHGACVCPDEGDCPCDHGAIETYGDHDYCVPELHDE